MSKAQTILAQYFSGLVTKLEALAALESLNVHGSFSTNGYTGYDYNNQVWVTL